MDYSVAFDIPAGPGIVEGPILDYTAGQVYVFATSDGSGLCPGGADCAAVYQLPTGFTAGDTGSEAVVGNSAIEPTAPESYVHRRVRQHLQKFGECHRKSLRLRKHRWRPTIYQVAIQARCPWYGEPGASLSSGTTPCSPVTDIMNANVSAASGGATEWIFASAEPERSLDGMRLWRMRL